MSLSSFEMRAIANHVNKYNLVPQLSTPPTMYFKDPTGKESRVNIHTLISEYRKDKQTEYREKARNRRKQNGSRI